ncbi:hypothetical protein [Humisphaera borealis]|uniref:Uncharacterized protein n=1 Tax=Humisphaera borealis TaxID=2807512 RepID=A0A7M2X072_9BACT|nr:hypothetical protein [Humisphaera borealis]QOV91054.1 hypothetical protein IPV69_06750 [Humisphaera borealis]
MPDELIEAIALARQRHGLHRWAWVVMPAGGTPRPRWVPSDASVISRPEGDRVRPAFLNAVLAGGR